MAASTASGLHLPMEEDLEEFDFDEAQHEKAKAVYEKEIATSNEVSRITDTSPRLWMKGEKEAVMANSYHAIPCSKDTAIAVGPEKRSIIFSYLVSLSANFTILFLAT